jgi:mannose-6-phosphate isomerase-like protein (cupin superfamily)
VTEIPRGLDLQRTYVVLRDGGATETIEHSPEFWDTVDQREELRSGRLVAVFPCDEDWTNWEMHPQADELVVLLSGAVDLVFEQDGGTHTVSLRGNESYIVPAGVWHRAVIHVPGTMLRLTRGQGTMYRPV